MEDSNKFLSFIKKVLLVIRIFFLNFGKKFVYFFVTLFKVVSRFFVNFYLRFKNGGWRTRVSHFIMGFSHFTFKRPIKALLYLFTQIGYIVFMVVPQGGLYWLSKFGTLGTTLTREVDACGAFPPVPLAECPPEDIVKVPVFGDNSMLIMLFSVATVLLTIGIILIYVLQLKGAFKAEKAFLKAKVEHNAAILENKVSKFVNPLPTFLEDLKSLFNHRFHFTTLSIPALTITVFTVLPLVFMVLLAFTNYNRVNGPPNKLFTWVGLETFRNLFNTSGSASFGKALFEIVQWTFVWAIAATFTNYIFGLILAMIINRRSIKAKKVWRTIFVISIAVPQFVTLLLMRNLLDYNGPLNATLIEWGLIDSKIKFLTDPVMAKFTVILVNIWVGVPYTMLITSGILMNIPSDLYESARIDGAGPVKQFTKITLPYMLFVTGPYLITQFIGNINNFNVIFFLTGGGPDSGQIGVKYGKTDILITWLYKITVGGAEQEYAIGSALGIFIFLISATITLVLYSRTSAATQEGDFA